MAELVIEAGRAERQYWRDLWRYRELFFLLAWRELLVRYKQTVVGLAWAVVRPVSTMVVLSFVYGKLGKMPSMDIPYPLMVFCGVLPWQFFASCLTEGGNSLLHNSNLISKVYFPRIIIPFSNLIVGLVDFAISGLLMVGLMCWYKFAPPVHLIYLPFFILLAISASLGSALWVSALIVKYRDFRFIVPFAVQFGLYLSPVGFTSKVLPDALRTVYSLNPMVGVINGFRWCLLGGSFQVFLPGFSLSVCVSILLLFSGIWYFRQTEKTFADVI